MGTNVKTDPLEGQAAQPIVFGEVLFDCFEDREVPGGAPLNVAWHLHALGWNPLLVSRVGQDEGGRTMVARMRDWGMDTSGIQHDPQHPTGRVEITMDGKSHTFDILADQAYDHIEPAAARSAAKMRQCGVLCHGSLALRGASRKAFTEVYNTTDAPVFLDINLREPWWSKDTVLDMIQRANILKLNDAELEILRPQGLASTPLAEAVLAARIDWGLDALWLTLGKQGALYCAEGMEPLRVEPDDAQAPVVDTVGAGDAFSAGILGGFLKGSTPEETAECATRLATRVCGQQGATSQNPDVYKGLEAITK